VRHDAAKYVNEELPLIHTNTIESFFSVFKRGMKGVYPHCAHHPLHRYLAEFDPATTTGRRLAWKMASGPRKSSRASKEAAAQARRSGAVAPIHRSSEEARSGSERRSVQSGARQTRPEEAERWQQL